MPISPRAVVRLTLLGAVASLLVAIAGVVALRERARAVDIVAAVGGGVGCSARQQPPRAPAEVAAHLTTRLRLPAPVSDSEPTTHQGPGAVPSALRSALYHTVLRGRRQRSL